MSTLQNRKNIIVKKHARIILPKDNSGYKAYPLYLSFNTGKMKNILFYLALALIFLTSCTQKKPNIQAKVTKHAYLAHIPSASGIEYAHHTIYLTGDDLRWLVSLNDEWNVTDSLALSAIDTVVNNRTPWNVKADFESIALFEYEENDYLLVLSSGSMTITRDTAHLINLTGDTMVLRKNIRGLYDKIKKQAGIPDGSEINIEGLAISDKAAYLLHRGNVNENFVVAVKLESLMNYLVSDDNQLPEITVYKFELPVYKEVPSGFSGACIVPGRDGMLFTASLEDTKSELYDGTILGSYIGYIPFEHLDQGTYYSVLLTDKDKTPINTKLESIVSKSTTGNKVVVLSVSDNDDGSSDLFEIEVMLKNLN